MKTYQKALQFCQSLHLKRNTNWRGNCPICGGSNSFSISNTNGKLLWLCFKNSCRSKGKENTIMSMEDIKELYRPEEIKTLKLKNCIGWTNNVKLYPEVIGYLNRNNCLPVFDRYPDRFFYDKVRDRVIFVEYDGLNDFKLATGRSLSGQIPKWFKYVSLPRIFYLTECLSSAILAPPTVIVEDCASACSISRIANGLALCGTSYNISGLLKTLHNVKDVIVCLDNDAQLKAMQLQRDLQGAGNFNSVKVVNTSDDIKYIKDLEILKGYIYAKL